jgi:hypothetical protein
VDPQTTKHGESKLTLTLVNLGVLSKGAEGEHGKSEDGGETHFVRFCFGWWEEEGEESCIDNW